MIEIRPASDAILLDFRNPGFHAAVRKLTGSPAHARRFVDRIEKADRRCVCCNRPVPTPDLAAVALIQMNDGAWFMQYLCGRCDGDDQSISEAIRKSISVRFFRTENVQ